MSKADMAILGLLAVEPMSGYDLKKLSEQSLSHFWHTSFGNLYPRLKRLAAAGHIRGRREERANAPSAVVYSLRPSGRAHLRQWLREPPAPERVHSEFLLKVFLGSHTDLAHTEKMVLDHEREQTSIRAGFEATEQALRNAMHELPEAAYWMMSLRRGQLLNEARLLWCEECREMIAQMKKRETTS